MAHPEEQHCARPTAQALPRPPARSRFDAIAWKAMLAEEEDRAADEVAALLAKLEEALSRADRETADKDAA